jgi:hypothetical protein
MITPGSPVTCAVANTSYPLSSTNKLIKTLKIQGLVAAHAGVISIGISAMVAATGVGVMAQLRIPTTNLGEKFELTEMDVPNGQNLADFFVQSSNAGDIVIFSYVEQ